MSVMSADSVRVYRANGGVETRGASGLDVLPLNIIVHIIHYLDDNVASLARLCRTSRVLYYMTLPQLWRSVTLTSYHSIRYKDELPEGFGSASPFSMGLNALVTRNVSSLVRSLALEGSWKAHDLEEYARVGRVSESAMILNIAVRAGLDRCAQLETFRWDLNTKPQPNVYAGLSSLSRLESLHLRFPTTRSPQPTTEIPPLPNLRSFTMTHYDPLCYPDDISRLLFHATKLEALQMHFSTRMRDQSEPSVHLSYFFRRNIAAKRKLRLKTVGLYNLFAGVDSVEMIDAVDSTCCEHFTSLNTFGNDEDRGPLSNGNATHFLDSNWLVPIDVEHPKPKSVRLDHLATYHAQDLARSTGLERLYLINARHKPDVPPGDTAFSSPPNSEASSPSASASAPCGSSTTPRSARGVATPNTALRDLYFDNICNVCGPTLQHLILPARWPLPTAMIARLIRSCPNLTQLSCAMECTSFDMIRMLMPFLSNLWAIRVLAPAQGGDEGRKRKAMFDRFAGLDDAYHEEKFAQELSPDQKNGAKGDFPDLKYIGLGHKVWEIGGLVEQTIQVTDQEEDGPVQREEIVWRRKVKRIQEKDVMDVEIWKMDTLDVI